MKNGLYVAVADYYQDGVKDYTKFVAVEDFYPDCYKVTDRALKNIIESSYGYVTGRTLHIVEVFDDVATVLYTKIYEFAKKTYWHKSNISWPVSYYTLAVERVEKEIRKMTENKNVDENPDKEVVPAEELNKVEEVTPDEAVNKFKGRYVAIQMKMKNSVGKMIDRFYLFDVTLETNKDNIINFANIFIGDSIAVAYLVEVYTYDAIIKAKKEYTPYNKTYWIQKNDIIDKSFLDDFRK